MRPVLLCSALAFLLVAAAPADAQFMRRGDDMTPVAEAKKAPAPKKRSGARKAAAPAQAPADAQAPKASAKDIADCAQDRDHDRAIAGCTRVIEDQRQKPKGRAGAHYNRGNAHNAKGEHDQAIADYDEAIKLDPKNARAYNNRGSARSDKGDTEGAIADFSEAIKADARFASAYFNRANALAARGETDPALKDYDAALKYNRRNVNAYIARGALLLAAGATAKARTDLRQAAALDRRNAYAVLWHDIAEKRGKQKGVLGGKAKGGKSLDMKAWPAPVVQLFAGDTKMDAVIAAADAPNATVKQAYVCEANFYSGQHALIGGHRDEAVKLFRTAAQNCPRGFLEGLAAAAELKGMGEKVEAN